MSPIESLPPRASQAVGLKIIHPKHRAIAPTLPDKVAALSRLAFDIVIFIIWFAAVSYQSFYHVMWRDEVRALSIALGGDNVVQMIKGLHGEGHPAAWYLLLRAAHSVVGRVEVLPGVAMIVAVATVALLIFRSPFPRLLIAGLVFSRLLFFEYSVMARNYGISVLILFLIAIAYEKHRDRGVVVGLLLFLLANTNLVGTLMVGAFLLFWFVDILEETGLRWTPKLNTFLLNACIAAVGVAICGLTILPTYNDAVIFDWSNASPVLRAVNALINPADSSVLFSLWIDGPATLNATMAASAILFCLPLGLLPRRAAFLSALFALFVTALFFALVTNGLYRHGGVWFFFCVTLYWIAWRDIAQALSGAMKGRIVKALTLVGLAGFVFLVGVQVFKNANDFLLTLANPVNPVLSRSADLGRLIASRSDLANATITSDVDFMVESLPYYIPNKTYLMHRHRFGNVVKVSISNTMTMTLGEILDESRNLKNTTGNPVVILLTRKLDQIVPDQSYQDFNWTFRASAEQIREFRTVTKLLAQFGPSRTNENYDVYLLD
jgi:hypothetical protein